MSIRSSKRHVLVSLLIVGIALALGWLSQRFTVSADLTANARHSLSPTTQSLLRSLDTPVEVIAVLGPDANTRRSVQTLIDRFTQYKPDISLRFLNPETQPAQARELNAAPGGELILRSGDREQRLQSLSERSLADGLSQLTRAGNRDIVFITGHGERSPVAATNDDWLYASQRLASIGLIAREQSLVSEPHLGDEIDLVVIAAPQRPYFPGELASLNDYLQRGGNLLWLWETPEVGFEGADLSIVSDNIGVDRLPGTVIDTASQTLNADTPDFVLLDRFPVHDVTRAMANPVLLPQAIALSVTPLAGQITEPLLQTPESSWTETGPLSGAIQFDENSDEVVGPLLLGVTVERELPTGLQRFAVIGDADFASSQFIGNGGNQSFVEALALWLTGDSDALQFVTRRAPDSSLQLNNRSIVLLSVLYLAALPVLLLMTAALVRWRRRSRRVQSTR